MTPALKNMKERVFDEIQKAFRPEFLNRLSDEAIIFRHLEKKHLKSVIDLELKKIRERLSERGYDLDLTNDAKEFLIDKGTDLGLRCTALATSIGKLRRRSSLRRTSARQL